ncbi:ATP-binding protein [Pseudomonas sp. RTS1]|uniref:AAA family ATPase n=1 Tax=unclassified Pseudomonas TaxID=196821 RepID=UPI002B23B55B|nr:MULTISPECIES: ATP-binding protein [unclassified Pseudomonas]MEA9992228.1 ATP-binding protein [Pseudomonas sp. RTS1]MEB0037404.1 ATP-binding protein [Pseudomonas sp. RTS2]MEB0237624.1 ATP-binding protein [Pseudomonas sp. 5S3]MEB0254272.1 ATP-binding protein [Pseudomonas sp. 5S2]
MKIKSVNVTGLFGKPKSFAYKFNSDLNILTGRNGSGKTTLMKLAWFIISGNVLLALREIDFKICTVVTDIYSCTVTRTGPVQCKIELEINGERYIFENDEGDPEYEPFLDSAEDKANPIIISLGSSIFFPTFRRIEGGFSMAVNSTARARPNSRSEFEIDDTLTSISRKLSNKEHVFISAISTSDVTSLLLRRYAAFSEEINTYQADVSRNVIDKIRQYEKTQSVRQEADALLSETRADIEKIEEFRSETMKPLDAIRGLVEKLFQHSGISFGKRLSFGDAAESVSSEALSAGEKQMLSFICYNAFYKNSVIFIDEPELSLHVDWQRQLYPILQSQNSGNQFIFATHSPFIYAKYPDKEVSIGSDRGE